MRALTISRIFSALLPQPPKNSTYISPRKHALHAFSVQPDVSKFRFDELPRGENERTRVRWRGHTRAKFIHHRVESKRCDSNYYSRDSGLFRKFDELCIVGMHVWMRVARTKGRGGRHAFVALNAPETSLSPMFASYVRI